MHIVEVQDNNYYYYHFDLSMFMWVKWSVHTQKYVQSLSTYGWVFLRNLYIETNIEN